MPGKDKALTTAFFITSAIVVVILYSGLLPHILPLPKCPLYSLAGLHCPGCGSQRALGSLLRGDLMGVFSAHVLFIPGLILCVFLYLTRKKDWAWQRNTKFTFGVLIVLIVFFILRNIPMHPFTILAPH